MDFKVKSFGEFISEQEQKDKRVNEILSRDKLQKMKFKFLRATKGFYYFDVKGNSFLRGRTKTLPLDLWVGDWYDFKEFKDMVLIKTDNTKDIIIEIV